MQKEESDFSWDMPSIIASLGRNKILALLEEMLQIRHFETRAEAAYLKGEVGGFFHSYVGQEAIQTAAVAACGKEQWWATSYRCHALALLLGCSSNELMAELYGRSTGNALGRGGSMHFYADNFLGGSGIVGGQIPLATGAAFTINYKKKLHLAEPGGPSVAFCFLGDGAVAQGAFHESLNLAALWNLPCIYVIENNQWGMGTAVDRALSVDSIARKKAPGYGVKSYILDGMNVLECYAAFQEIFSFVKTNSQPVLVEAKTERFKGHSISDPGLYRSKESLKNVMDNKDPIILLKNIMLKEKILSEKEWLVLDKKYKDQAIAAMDFASQSPWPEVTSLEQDVFANNE